MTENVIISKEVIEAMGLLKQDSVELTKGSKAYQWNIKLYSKDLIAESDAILARISAIDTTLKKNYGEQQ